MEWKNVRYYITPRKNNKGLFSGEFLPLLKQPQLTLNYLYAHFVEELTELSFGDAVFFSDLKAYGTGYAVVFSPLFDSLDYLIMFHGSS
jgi:hypothetical protein